MVLDDKNYEKEIEELDNYIDSLSNKEGKLIAVLHKAQDLFGYLPEKLQNHVARKLSIPTAKVFGVVSFYSFFNTEKKGEFKVAVCMGTACFVRGSEEVLEEFKKELHLEVSATDDKGLFSLDGIRCVGACGLAPVVSVNGHVYGRVKKEDVPKIISECLLRGGEKNE